MTDLLVVTLECLLISVGLLQNETTRATVEDSVVPEDCNEKGRHNQPFLITLAFKKSLSMAHKCACGRERQESRELDYNAKSKPYFCQIYIVFQKRKASFCQLFVTDYLEIISSNEIVLNIVSLVWGHTCTLGPCIESTSLTTVIFFCLRRNPQLQPRHSGPFFNSKGVFRSLIFRNREQLAFCQLCTPEGCVVSVFVHLAFKQPGLYPFTIICFLEREAKIVLGT